LILGNEITQGRDLRLIGPDQMSKILETPLSGASGKNRNILVLSIR